MPLRKRKGRRGPKLPPPAESKESTPSEDNAEQGRVEEEEIEPGSPAATANDASMDEEERRARETIALLAQKYQVKLTEESSESLDIIRVDESAEFARQPELQQSAEKENIKTSKLVPKKRTKLQKRTQRGSTPVFKVPKPLTHHSTPAPSGDGDLFGFENLDSPLTLSPVTTTPAGRGVSLPDRLSPEAEEGEGGKVTKPSPYSRLQGTYDIPLKKKTPRRPAARRRKSTSGEERWAAHLNAQFSEVEQFELAVE